VSAKYLACPRTKVLVANRLLRALTAAGHWGALGLLSLTCASALAQSLPDLWTPAGALAATRSQGVLPGDQAVLVCPDLPTATQTLSLGDVLDLALCNNPQVKAALAGVKVRASGVGEAQAAYWPVVSGAVNRLKNDTRFPEFPSSNTSKTGNTKSLNLTWRLFDFGGREAIRDAADQLLLAATAGHEAALQKTLANVVRAYYEALTAKSLLDLKTETVRLSAATLGSARQREAKGAAAIGDVLQAQTALLKENLGEQRAQSDHRKALAALLNAMGAAAGTPLNLHENMAEPAVTQPIRPAPDWLSYAEATHPAIMAAQAQVAEAQKRVVAARSEGLPSLDLTGTYYKNGSPSQGLASAKSTVTNIGVVLNVPLFDGFAKTYKTYGASAQVEQVQAQLHETRYQVRTQILQSHADAEAARQNLAPSAQLLAVAQASVATSTRRYDKGVADIQELLNAQGALTQARQERLRSVMDWRSARLQLLANTGLLGRARAVSNDQDVLPPTWATPQPVVVPALRPLPALAFE
jgi:outer membrane protein